MPSHKFLKKSSKVMIKNNIFKVLFKKYKFVKFSKSARLSISKKIQVHLEKKVLKRFDIKNSNFILKNDHTNKILT